MASRAFRFMPDSSGTTNLASDKRIALLAACIAHQQAAGFGLLLDLRQADCPICKAPGFNTGWGSWRFACEAEVVDGDLFEPCRAEAQS